jgi:hypothetical protein
VVIEVIGGEKSLEIKRHTPLFFQNNHRCSP